MFQAIGKTLANAGDLFSAEVKIALRRLGWIAGSAMMLLGFVFLSVIAVLVLAAAAAVALAPAVGTAAALATVGSILLALCLIGIVLALSAVRNGPMSKTSPPSEKDVELILQRDCAMARLLDHGHPASSGKARATTPPSRAPAGQPNFSLGGIDPITALASVAAVTAILGPKRIFQIIGVAQSGIGMVRAASAGFEAMRTFESIRDALGGGAKANVEDECEVESSMDSPSPANAAD